MIPEVYDTAYGLALSSIYDRLYALSVDTVDCVAALADGTSTAAEYGVGTGRIAVPLAARGVEVHGVDLSADFLEVARRAATAAGTDVHLTRGDMSSWQPPSPVDIAYSVCASLTMLPTEGDLGTALRSMAAAIHPEGRVVIENHHPTSVVELCRQELSDLRLPVDSLPGGVAMQPSLGDGSWTALLTWDENGRQHQVLDRCLLVEPDRLADLAAAVGLREVERVGGWTGQPLTANSAVYISTFRAV